MPDKKTVTRIIVTAVRIAVGWHFLYEGLIKLFNPGWTSFGYLSNTSGFLSGFYHWLASDPVTLGIVDTLNVWGLILVGIALFTGLFVRAAAMGGFAMLALYYFAYPPFGPSMLWPTEGQLYIVDRNFIEAMVMLYFVFAAERGYGIDALRNLIASKLTRNIKEVSGEGTAAVQSRREILKNLATLPFLGALGFGTFRLRGRYDIDVLSGATIQIDRASLAELKGPLPKGKIGTHKISRLVLGGNLIGGWAHARDLIYASSLFRAYNTERKVYETLGLAENAGIDSINIGASSGPLMAKYKKMTGSRIKVITQVAPNMNNGDIYENINRAIDEGADILQIQGNWCDWLVRDNRLDVIVKMMDRIRGQGYTAGLGAHSDLALRVCEENGIIPDYYMVTMHHDNYWSAHPRENRIDFEVDGQRHAEHGRFHDNIFCLFPERAAEFVNRATVPVMGFKVLAAGAIRPEDGFRWAFENGSDFICVGMFDFQIVQDVNITIDVLNSMENRKRGWYA
ncbi:MAG: DoxX family protein [Marinilabiliales bacterium]|nr:MAG: DoxX family protein [Marinilabiliales bacterium]